VKQCTWAARDECMDRMTDLHKVLERYVSDGSVTGAVALLAARDAIEVAAVGSATVGGASWQSIRSSARFDHEADHRGSGHDLGRGWPDLLGGHGRSLATGTGGAKGGPNT
jgi:hypothetical protein